MRLILKNLGLLSAVLIALTVGLASPSGAATRFVDATTGSDALNDCLSAASPCQTITYTLTQAVPNDTISVAAGTYDTALGETFPLVIAVNLTLTGAGQGSCGSPGVTCIDAVGTNRVITVNGGVTATISGVTVTGGSVSCTNSGGFSCVAQGGGLFNSGTLTLTNSTVSGNMVSCIQTGTNGACFAQGGGIFNSGTLTLTNSTVSGNTASCTNSGGVCTAEGSGLFFNSGILILTNSTVSGNTASCTNNGASSTFCFAQGGGIFNSGTLTLTNSTVSGNTASCTNSGGGSCFAQGGGLFDSLPGTLTLTNSTVSGNTVSCSGSCTAAGSGLWSQGTATLTATIIAKQLLGSDCFAFFFTSITSNGFNLDSDNTCNLTGTGDQPGVTNPLLGPLANNGGPTQTQALLTGSPAIDAVTSGCPPPATDQRGVSRPQGPHCDIGAYELVQTNAAIPTLSEWAQLAMLTLLFGGGLFALRRRVHPA